MSPIIEVFCFVYEELLLKTFRSQEEKKFFLTNDDFIGLRILLVRKILISYRKQCHVIEKEESYKNHSKNYHLKTWQGNVICYNI